MSRRHGSRGNTSAAKKLKVNRPNAKPRTSAVEMPAAARSPQRIRFETTILPLILLIFITFLAFGNAWPNSFTYDDTIFSTDKRAFGLSLAEIGHYFTSDVWAANGGGTSLYRPLLLVSVAIDILIFDDWLAGYHLVNIFLHLMVTLLVFGFIRHVLLNCRLENPVASHIALLAGLIFAVHPVHTEVVNSIFNRSEMLVSLCVVGGTWWFLRTVDRQPTKAWAWLSVIYLVAMLCRETGIILPGITVVFLWILSPGTWQSRLRKCIPVFWLLIPLVIYFGLRTQALEPPPVVGAPSSKVEQPLNEPAPDSQPGTGGESNADLPASQAKPSSNQGITRTRNKTNRLHIPYLNLYVGTENLLPAVSVWFDALKLMLWPDPLFTFRGASGINGWVALFLQLALLALSLTLLMRKQPGMILGLAFFYLAILPSSRIVSEVDTGSSLAERFLYLPSVGITIILAFGLGWLLRRATLKIAIIPVLLALMVLTPLTWARNAEWASSLTLSESDFKNGRRWGKTLEVYASSLLKEGELTRARALCEEYPRVNSSMWYFEVTCGQVYASLGRFSQAEDQLLHASRNKSARVSAHFSLAKIYLAQNRRSEAREQFELAIAAEKKAYLNEFLQAEMLMRLYPYNREMLLEAEDHLKASIELQPQYFQALQKLAILTERLEDSRLDQNLQRSQYED